ncbi:translation elongation factor Ts [Sediminispirochaeta bajacaliforniensis]|uniref:translation elongation factor Ts n=1 Tax=Sediminispirochaeta bajacaliforniensis TaxID=148 RepID=UPI00036BB8D8|nr:translation elongation factor Ts [Sediminispirochaeta bajacaliforniensis]
MEIKAADVKKLRDKTGAGMMDCKKALTESGGDFAKAEKHLKELGLAAAAKRSGRATNEGRVFSKVEDKRAGLLELACETDFVARNKDFIKLGEELLGLVINKGYTEINADLEERVKDTISTIKENMSIKRFTSLEIADNEMVTDYIHGEGGIGVLVKLKAEKPELLGEDSVKTFAFDAALHIAAFNPLYLDRSKVDEKYRKEQEEIFRKQAEHLGKPEKVLAGIVQGKLNKHYSEICLLDQGFVKDEKQSVSKVLAQLSKEVGGKLEIVDFRYYRVGDEN